MKTIYLDSNFMCYLEEAPDRISIETDIFDNTVEATIPYYRYIPQGEEWTNPKTGATLHGLFIQAIDSAMIDRIAQQAYIADMQNALALLGVTE